MKSETIYNIYEKYNIRIPDIVRLDRKHPKLDFTQVYADFDQFVDLNKLVYVLKHYNTDEHKKWFRISLSRNYLTGKIWMINKLEEHFSRNLKCIVVGGWIGVVALVLNYIFDNVLSIDIRPECTEIARRLGINARTQDMFEIDYSKYDLIINTSCEHIDVNKWFDIIPSGSLICAQSTNFEWPTHVNIVESTENFMEQAGLQDYYFAGKISKNGKKHWRYMIIGKK
jgi:hypothetical protein